MLDYKSKQFRGFYKTLLIPLSGRKANAEEINGAVTFTFADALGLGKVIRPPYF